MPTASPLLNLVLGEGDFGLAAGRVYELFGDFSHGKSTIAQILMNAIQAAGGVSVLLDSESAWNRPRAIAMGHNAKRHLAVDIETCNMGFEVIRSTIDEFKRSLGGRVPILFVWDTIAASPTADEKSGDEYGSGMAYKARFIRAQLALLTPELKKIQASIVFVNQTIQSLDANKKRSGVKTTSGGGGIKFWSSQRIQVTKVGMYPVWGGKTNKEDRQLAGIISQIKMVKNKLHPPFKTADLPINFRTGVDPLREVTNYLLDNTSIYNVRGAYKSIVGFGEKDITAYEKDIPQVVEDTPGLYDWMVEQMKSHWLTGDTF